MNIYGLAQLMIVLKMQDIIDENFHNFSVLLW